ncbi:MAG TPA: transglutaminase-like cysteine peptidase [Gammaproteobacteria bacterium]|nr:transglutaminase-like cysteine peptidase [Gammaproteobacteria bacterium]
MTSHLHPPAHIPTASRWSTWLMVLSTSVLSQLAQATPSLFGYQEAQQNQSASFSQWIRVLERHIREDLPEADCTATTLNRCHLREWQTFLSGIRGLPLRDQLQRINAYANEKRYIIDLENYGLEDYWAIAREFLYNGGDCEDYALTKLFSLLWLGFDPEQLRIVVLQDTNLRVPHAVLAVYDHNEILVMDNQIQQVVDHRQIVHYVPVYSINEKHWWIHTPVL